MSDRASRPVRGGLAVGVVTGGLIAAWWWAGDVHECEQTGVLACTGPVLAVVALGVPVAVVLAVLALRWAGSASGLLALLVTGLATWGLVLLSEAVGEPPVGAWAVVHAALVCIYLSVEGSRSRRAAQPRDA